jgi:four helix bundle protein
MSGAQSYRDLLIWQKGMDLCAACYLLTSKLPADERFGLMSQMRRAAVSVPSNIAEGFARETKGVFVNHLRIAQGSLKEIETQLLICQRVGFLQQNDVEPLVAQCEEIGRMLRSFIRSIPV